MCDKIKFHLLFSLLSSPEARCFPPDLNVGCVSRNVRSCLLFALQRGEIKYSGCETPSLGLSAWFVLCGLLVKCCSADDGVIRRQT